MSLIISLPFAVKTYSCLGLLGESFWVGSTNRDPMSGLRMFVLNLLLLASPAFSIKAEIGNDGLSERAIRDIADYVS